MLLPVSNYAPNQERQAIRLGGPQKPAARPPGRIAALASLPEEVLLDLHLAGSPEAFGVLLERYRNLCLSIAGRILRNPAQAEDEVQTSFMKAFAAFGQFEGRAAFSAWLKRIVVNQCRMHLRAERRRRTDSAENGILDVHSPHKSPEECAVESDLVQLAGRAARRLPAPMRAVFRLIMLEGKTTRQCGLELGLSDAAVKARLRRARQQVLLSLRER